MPALPEERRGPLLVAALSPPFALSERGWIGLGALRFLDLCPSPAVLAAACAALEQQAIRQVPEPEVVSVLAGGRPEDLAGLAEHGGAMTRAMVQRARYRQRGGELTTVEVRREIRQRFWEGLRLESYDTEHQGLNPCALCGEVYRALGLVDLGAGARGAILAPNEEGGEGVRGLTKLTRGFLSTPIVCNEGSPPEPDDAVLEVIQEVLESGAVGERTIAQQQCCELGALHLLAAEIRRQAR